MGGEIIWWQLTRPQRQHLPPLPGPQLKLPRLPFHPCGIMHRRRGLLTTIRGRLPIGRWWRGIWIQSMGEFPSRVPFPMRKSQLGSDIIIQLMAIKLRVGGFTRLPALSGQWVWEICTIVQCSVELYWWEVMRGILLSFCRAIRYGCQPVIELDFFITPSRITLIVDWTVQSRDQYEDLLK